MILPNFLVIGAQKTGTKWLHWNLRMHPAFFLPHAGGGLEVHYFDSDIPRTPSWYQGHYLGGGTFPFRGDITPDYAPLPKERVEEVYKLLPNAKVIYTLRNPKHRAISAARMELRGLTFAGNPRSPKLLDEHSSAQSIIDYCCTGEGFKHGDYLTHLNTWLSVYPEEQVLLLPYSLMVSDPVAYLLSIYRFLGSEYLVNKDRVSDRVHVSDPYPMPSELYSQLDDTYNPQILALRDRLPFTTSDWLLSVGD